jgi:RHS repeat-associated protein
VRWRGPPGRQRGPAGQSGGESLEPYVNTPYGVLTIYDATWSNVRSVSRSANAHTRTGRQRDAETGLYYYRYRSYHSQLGRFASRDPVGYQVSGWNLHEYVDSRPTIGTDPSGELRWPWGSEPWGEKAKVRYSCTVYTLYWPKRCVVRQTCSGVCTCTIAFTESLVVKSLLKAASKVCCVQLCMVLPLPSLAPIGKESMEACLEQWLMLPMGGFGPALAFVHCTCAP